MSAGVEAWGEGADPELNRLLGSAVEAILSETLSPDGVAEFSGEAFLACERAARERPSELAAALAADELEAFLRPHVRACLTRERPERFNGGWGAFVGPDARAIESDAVDNTDVDALETSRRAITKAFAIARSEGNETMERNLAWYRERLAHRTYVSIARAERKPAATVRTGVARAKKLVLQIVHELQQAQPAPLSGDAPQALEPLRALWEAQDTERLTVELERTRAAYADDPHWLNLAGLLAADRGRGHEARAIYERALVATDAPSVRCRLLNNLGNLTDELGNAAEAKQYWLRAHQLVPAAPAPLLNLLAAASVEKSYASAQHHIAKLAELMSSSRLSDAERSYVCRRLRENPRLRWLRQTEAWRLGPARWIRRRFPRASQVRTAGAVAALLGALLLGLFAALGSGDAAGAWFAEGDRPAVLLVGGGDSMGKPLPAPTSRRPSGKRRG